MGEKENQAHELTDIDVLEVSLVGSPANKRRFLLMKNEEGNTLEEQEKGLAKKLLDFFSGLVTEKKEETTKSEPVKEPPKVEPPKEDVEKTNLKAQVDALSKERDALKVKAEEIEKADKKREIEAIAKTIFGKTEDNIAYLEPLSKALPKELFAKMVEREQSYSKKLAENLFVEKGVTTQAPGPDTPAGKLEAMVKAEVAKGTNAVAAWDKVIHENMPLYDQYTKENVKVANSEKGGK